MKKTERLLNLTALIYFSASAALAASDWVAMAGQNRKCRCIERGQERLCRPDVRRIGLYSAAQIQAAPALGSVELYFLPGEGKRKRPYILYIPGGAYLECDPRLVALPSAAEANQAGYSAFVLKYRVRRHSDDYAPLDDLAAAIRYISAHADELNVDADRYMLCGFSAGGNLAGLFAAESIGYAKYALGKPSALTLVYPWTNIGAPIKASGNIIKDGYMLLGRTLALRVMLGRLSSRAEREALCVHRLVTRDYPPCLLAHGDKDFLVPKEQNSDLMVRALEESGVDCKYTVYPGLTHGFGLGVGTPAEGWIKESIAFFEKQCM